MTAPLIGVLLPVDVRGRNMWNASMTQALSAACLDAGTLPIVVNDGEQPGDDVVRGLRGNVVQGLIASATATDVPWIDQVVSGPIPVVTIGRHPIRVFPWVDLNGRDAMAAIVRHLCELDRGRQALITGPAHKTDVRERRDGFETQLEADGGVVDPRMIVEGDFTEASGQAAWRDVLSEFSPEAVIAMNDEMAFGVIRALAADGLSIPGDVAVAGLDGTLLPRPDRIDDARPFLTTVRQPYELIAESAVSELLVAIDGGEPSPSTVLPGELIVGDSTHPRYQRGTSDHRR